MISRYAAISVGR